MKNLKIAFLFFCASFFFQTLYGSNTVLVKSFYGIGLDSTVFYIKKMKNTSLPDSISLKYANEALQWANKENLNSKKKEILRHKIYLFGKLRHYDRAIQVLKMYSRLIAEKDANGFAENYVSTGYYYRLKAQKDSAYHYFELSNEIYKVLQDSSKIGENLTHMAGIQSDLGDYSGSDHTAIEALKFIDKNNTVYLTIIYNCLAISSRKQKEYHEAIYWYDKAINISTINSYKIKILQNKSNAYRCLGNYDKAINILDSLNNVPIKSKETKARIIDNLAYATWLNGDDSGISFGLHEAMKIRLVENDTWGLIASYSHLSEYYKNKDAKLSLEFAAKMCQLANQQKSPQDQLEALQKLIDLDTSLKVKEYYARYIRINDSLQDAESRAKNKFAKIKYDSEKNREDNLQLKISASEKELELEKEKTRNIIGATSSATVVLGLVGFGYYRRKKHQQEKRAEVYKTETRIAKKIHDEVANNVVNIMNKVQYTEEPKEDLLDDLEKVYLLTRNISHQNNAIETGTKFVVSLKSLLTSFNSTTTTIILKNIHDVELETVSKEKQIEIYRILQELMVNMQKHSEASLVAISFKNSKNQYLINYSDNGVGVNLETISLKSGIENVETRIKSLNGTINFESSLNNGFKVFISFKK